MMSRYDAMEQGSSGMLNSLLKVFGKQVGVNFTPLYGDTQLLFCSYALHEELKEKFDFLERDEKYLYNIIINLPFETDKEEVSSNLRELIRIDYKQHENLGQFFSKLNDIKKQWSRHFFV